MINHSSPWLKSSSICKNPKTIQQPEPQTILTYITIKPRKIPLSVLTPDAENWQKICATFAITLWEKRKRPHIASTKIDPTTQAACARLATWRITMQRGRPSSYKNRGKMLRNERYQCRLVRKQTELVIIILIFFSLIEIITFKTV